MLKSQKVIERARQAEKRDVAISEQLNQQRSKKADGGIHTVQHTAHESRAQQAEALTEVAVPEKRRWRRAKSLAALPTLPGFATKYVRIDGRTHGDNRRLSEALYEGWELCRKTDFPKRSLPTQTLAGRGEVIGNGDMVLMKMPEEMVDERNAHFHLKRDTITRNIDQELKEETRSSPMPLIENTRKSTSSLMRQRRAAKKEAVVSDDE